MKHLRRLPLRPAASAALTALFALALAVAPLSTAASAQQQAGPQAPAGPNGKIVFESDQAGELGINDIYTMDADGKRETRLTTEPAHDGSPVWSPQGDKIAFISTRRGPFEIYLMNADGSNQRPLRAGGVHTFDPVGWSPDGTRLAYVSGGSAYVIEAVAPGGGDSTAAPIDLSADKLAGSKDIDVNWSPGGGRLVLRNDLSGGGTTDLYTVNADGTGRAHLITGPGFDTHPRWSPDGTRIVYVADRGTPGLYVIDAAGVGGEQRITTVPITLGPPSWSPDGTRVAFASISGAVYTANADGSGETMLSETSSTPSNGPFWSPDGQKVAFQKGGDIYVVNSDGTSRRAANYTKTRRADEYACSWQRIATP